MPATATRKLSTADERREDILAAAMETFAERGLYGTPTADVAKAAGLSQAYLFRLFPTKTELYVATVERCFERTLAAFRDAAAEAKAAGREPLEVMGEAYVGLLGDPELLLGQLHAHAAGAREPEVRAAVRTGFGRLYDFVAQATGAPADRIRDWFAFGMLLNVLAAMDAPGVDEPWAHALLGPKDC